MLRISGGRAAFLGGLLTRAGQQAQSKGAQQATQHAGSSAFGCCSLGVSGIEAVLLRGTALPSGLLGPADLNALWQRSAGPLYFLQSVCTQHQVRSIASTAHQRQQAARDNGKQQAQQAAYDSLELTQERINSITDKIPQRPVGVVEGTSYSVLILAAFSALVFVLYQFVFNFILEPTAMQCFNYTLDLLKSDPRVTVRLGAEDEIRAWGSNSQSRVARQQVPHQIYKDANGAEHVRIQFYMRGPSGTGMVSADMHRDPAAPSKWAYTYLLVDVYSGNSQTPSRLYVVRP
mmetsp:Transcript_2028/g.3156  ORF Transcript_2028/g.3156 Transcript_2028/m.3156 type:complete len:290 (+) Transcript_2028:29-898(+)